MKSGEHTKVQKQSCKKICESVIKLQRKVFKQNIERYTLKYWVCFSEHTHLYSQASHFWKLTEKLHGYVFDGDNHHVDHFSSFALIKSKLVEHWV